MTLSFSPAVYEHKAALIGASVAAVAGDADLLFRALAAERSVYDADHVTVGVDIYNLEAEALGARVAEGAPMACPDIPTPPYTLETLPGALPEDILSRGRFGVMLAAARAARPGMRPGARLRVAATAPVTLAARLVGLEALLTALWEGEGAADRALRVAEALTTAWCQAIREAGFEVVLFDSMAAPPFFGPAPFARIVRPTHARLMRRLESSGQAERELVIGGDTTAVLPSLMECGATLLLCDYAADAKRFADALGGRRDLRVRRNAPLSVLTEKPGAEAIDRFRGELERFDDPVAGSAILPYDFPPERWLAFRRRLSL